MTATVLAQQQIESFWNLIRFSDENIQKGLYVLLDSKYGKKSASKKDTSFLQLKGVLKTEGSQQTDKQLIDDYLKEKYGL